MSRRTEDMIRRMMGMPTRKEEKRRRKEQDRRRKTSGRNGYGPTRHPQNHPAEMMKSVAVDVEYTEIKEFNSTTIVEDQNDNTKIITEEQITDVEFTEIKSKQ